MSVFFTAPNQTLQQDVFLTSSLNFRFFSGTLPTNAVSAQVSIRGGAFTSDNDLITFEGGSFTVPNPASNSRGLQILQGDNTIQVRSIDGNGNVSQPATFTVRKTDENALGLLIETPTGLRIEQRDQDVLLLVDQPSDSTNIQGVNFYATTTSGQDYFQINPELVTDFTTEESKTQVSTTTQRDNTPPATFPITINGVSQNIAIPSDTALLETGLTFSQVSQINTYFFPHDREGNFPDIIPVGEFASLQENEDLFYTCTFLYYDPVAGVETESDFSNETSGRPLQVTDTIGTFPVVSRGQIEQDFSVSIFRTREDLDIKAGSYTKDAVIDPAATQFNRVYFLLDFLQRAQSFTTLLEIDDPDLSGESLPVDQSAYKTSLKDALFLVEDEDVQVLIDLSFEQLAARVNETRREGTRAVGEVTVYAPRRPTSSEVFSIGEVVIGGGINFRLTQEAEIDINSIASFFEPSTGRYAIRVFVEAEELGEAGIVAAGQINEFETPRQGFFVINESPTFGGRERESNYELAIRSQRKLNAIRTSSRYFYEQAALEIGGVEDVFSITASDPLMKRPEGSVDIWIRGQSVSTVTESFSLPFQITQNAVFVNSGVLEFRSLDPLVSEENPIIEMLDVPSQNFTFFNARTGFTYDLTNVTIVDFRTIRLDSTLNSASSYVAGDTFFGTYRFLESQRIVLNRQPVLSVEALEGEVEGFVTPTLERADDPLELGYSTQAQDSLFLSLAAPLNDPITITDETHVLIGEVVDYLENLGVNPYSIRVFNEDRTIEYNGPFSTSTADFFIEFGDAKNAYGIFRNTAGNITSGQTVLVDYEHDEVFTATYSVNALTGVVQNELDQIKNVSENILVKEAVPLIVDIGVTVILERRLTRNGVTRTSVDSAIRTNITNALINLRGGTALRQSDIIGIIEGTQGVSYCEVPITQLAPAVGTQIINETVRGSTAQLILDYSTGTNSVYLIDDPLRYKAQAGGGDLSFVRFADDTKLNVLETFTPFTLSNTSNSCFIFGFEGTSFLTFTNAQTANKLIVSVPGGVSQATERIRLSDSQISYLSGNLILTSTLTVAGFTENTDYVVFETSDGRVGLRRVQTGSVVENQEVDVSYTKQNAEVTVEDLSVTYTVGSNEGVVEIAPSNIQYIEIGNIDLTLDEDTI